MAHRITPRVPRECAPQPLDHCHMHTVTGVGHVTIRNGPWMSAFTGSIVGIALILWSSKVTRKAMSQPS